MTFFILISYTSFSPQLRQNLPLGGTSVPHFEHLLTNEAPQRKQNLPFLVFSPHLGQIISSSAKKLLLPHSKQNLAFDGNSVLHFGHIILSLFPWGKDFCSKLGGKFAIGEKSL